MSANVSLTSICSAMGHNILFMAANGVCAQLICVSQKEINVCLAYRQKSRPRDIISSLFLFKVIDRQLMANIKMENKISLQFHVLLYL